MGKKVETDFVNNLIQFKKSDKKYSFSPMELPIGWAGPLGRKCAPTARIREKILDSGLHNAAIS